MADKPKIDIGVLFGKPKGAPGADGGEGGPDEDFRAQAAIALGDGDMDTRADALYELIKQCMRDEDADEAAPEGEPKEY